MQVLLVEDDVMVGKALVQALERAANATHWVRDGASALEALAGGDHDVVLLDVGLPDRSGFSVVDALRGGGNDIPILIITARDALEDRIHGLDLGADDYVVKPFDPDELMARMRATVRRRFGVIQSVLETADLKLNLASHELTYKDRSCLLPGREFELMRILMERAGTILSRSQLERMLYGVDAQIESNSIDVLIYSIRRRFDKGIMRNVRGAGWMIAKRRA